MRHGKYLQTGTASLKADYGGSSAQEGTQVIIEKLVLRYVCPYSIPSYFTSDKRNIQPAIFWKRIRHNTISVLPIISIEYTPNLLGAWSTLDRLEFTGL